MELIEIAQYIFVKQLSKQREAEDNAKIKQEIMKSQTFLQAQLNAATISRTFSKKSRPLQYEDVFKKEKTYSSMEILKQRIEMKKARGRKD